MAAATTPFAVVGSANVLRFDETRTHLGELVVFHPTRGSIVSITSTSVQEIDVANGAVIGETAFDLLLTGNERVRQFEYLTPIGNQFVVAIHQGRCIVTWDLNDMALYSVVEIDRAQKSIVACTGSLCAQNWLFYCTEASQSIKVTCVGGGGREVPKKITRKPASRNSVFCCLAYCSVSRLIACGTSDGIVQLFWFSTENAIAPSNVMGGKDKDKDGDNAVATLVYSCQSVVSPVVSLAFGGIHNDSFVAAAFANRSMELWQVPAGFDPNQPVEPTRVATTLVNHLTHATVDFCKKNGDLSFVFHPFESCLLVHWNPSESLTNTGGVSIASIPGSAVTKCALWELTGNQVSEAVALFASSYSSNGNGSDAIANASSSSDCSLVCFYRSGFVSYISSFFTRELNALVLARTGVSSSSMTSTPPLAPPKQRPLLSLSSVVQLSLDEYLGYDKVPSCLLQIGQSSEPSESGFVLQKYALASGETQKLCDLPLFKSYQGRVLMPHTLLCAPNAKAVCVLLREIPDVKGVRITELMDSTVSYTLVDLSGSTTVNSNVDLQQIGAQVECSPLHEALDVCFIEPPALLTGQVGFCLMTLATSGKSLCVQTKLDQVDSNRIMLPVPVKRIFATPLSIPSTSPFASLGTRLLYLMDPPATPEATSATASQVLCLSDDQMLFTSQWMWQTRPNETILRVQWSSASSLNQNQPEEMARILVVVETMQRLVVLNGRLQCISELPKHTNAALHPQSLLWVDQTLVFTTNSFQVRYWTPVNDLGGNKPSDGDPRASSSGDSSRFLCSLVTPQEAESANDFVQTNLLMICHDRLCYMTIDCRTFESKTMMRGQSFLELLLASVPDPTAHPHKFLTTPPSATATTAPTTGEMSFAPLAQNAMTFSQMQQDKIQAILQRERLLCGTNGCDASRLASQRLLTLLNQKHWEEVALDMVLQATPSEGGSNAGASGDGSSPTAFGLRAHLSNLFVCSLLLGNGKAKEALGSFLASDPGLHEYVLGDGASAKLPSRNGLFALQLVHLGHCFAQLGEFALAFRCFDLAGDEQAVLQLGLEFGSLGNELLAVFTKDLGQVNAPLASLVGSIKNQVKSPQQPSPTREEWRGLRHDLFALLCDDVLVHDRRSRLISANALQSFHGTKGLLQFQWQTSKAKHHPHEQRKSQMASNEFLSRAFNMALSWKRLAPEDWKDCVGSSTTPHFSSEETRGLAALFAASNKTSSGVAENPNDNDADGALGATNAGERVGGRKSVDNSNADAFASNLAMASAARESATKLAIGPFLDDEDAVVAYWRFEEGVNFQSTSATESNGFDTLDTCKRENHLNVFGTHLMSFVASSAPVDKGEEGKLQEEYALRFPASASASATSNTTDWGAKCAVKPGSTLDLATGFDDDPYRRRLTFEAWVRNYTLAATTTDASKSEANETEVVSPVAKASQPGEPFDDQAVRVLVARQGLPGAAGSCWQFALDKSVLMLSYGSVTLKATADNGRLEQANGTWHHVAFSIDVVSPKQTMLRLFLDGQLVGSKELDGSSCKPVTSTNDSLVLGKQLTDLEITEVRLWAAARTSEQITDMKENYLGIAEAKKRLKVTIHQRNCQCEKCQGRRQKAPTAKLAMVQPFASTPPSRERRRPAAPASTST